ncbi:hypothetical protein D9619_008215 [Psilocybe cf. subviscida]|uniref:NACHT domain-containing protein n=1 Tax=Psilocybe cf. subviscida TaxID=2480587 RepID=A0A8H5ESM6_9AGAR|nr:hypothetical protein D9619_008215 [Psilocybe cf. subviscida]
MCKMTSCLDMLQFHLKSCPHENRPSDAWPFLWMSSCFYYIFLLMQPRPLHRIQMHSSGKDASILQHAKGTTINGGTFNTNSIRINQISTEAVSSIFIQHLAPSALQNAVGQLNPSTCFPGTRNQVLADIESWIDGPDGLQRRILWMTGPAGSGKSAIVQSIFERCARRQLSVASFFFSRHDCTRNHIGTLVATLTYQLSISPGYPEAHSSAKKFILSAVDANPIIFAQSIDFQFCQLIIGLIQHLSPSSSSKPTILLIDGLDECTSKNLDEQTAFVKILHDRVGNAPELPCRILVASRPEAHLTMAFNQLGKTMLKFLVDDNRYDPEADIRHFVSAQFDLIKNTHHLAKSLCGEEWPPQAAIDYIVRRSSKQFLYAAAVMRFIATSPACPDDSLTNVMRGGRGHSPSLRFNKVFSYIDAIFTNILSTANRWDKISSILAAEILLTKISSLLDNLTGQAAVKKYHIQHFLRFLSIRERDVDSYMSSLTALVTFDHEDHRLIFYHPSLADFLIDKARSGKYHIDLNSFSVKLVAKILRSPEISQKSSYFSLMALVLSSIKLATIDLGKALHLCPDIQYNFPYSDFSLFLITIERLYHQADNQAYESLLRTWFKWSQLYMMTKESSDRIIMHLRRYHIASGVTIWMKVDAESCAGPPTQH